MKSRYAPVVLFVYNRADKVKNVIESLQNCKLIEKSEVHIFADAANRRKSGDKKKVNEVSSFLDELEKTYVFGKLTIHKSVTHKGLANSVIDGVSSVIKASKQVIVVEDDLILSPDFLVFMNKALQYYRHDKRIWSISGFTKPLTMPSGYLEDVYFAYRGSSLGWGTWINRWEKIDWEIKDYNIFRRSLFRQLKFDRGGFDMSGMLMDWKKGKIDSWAIRWCYEESKRNMLTVYPCNTLVLHTGGDKNGTNTKAEIEQGSMEVEGKNYKMAVVKLDRRLLREFRNHYEKFSKRWIEQFISNFNLSVLK